MDADGLRLDDPFANDGFRPGLRPRLHLGVAEFLAADDAEPEDALEAGDELDAQELVIEALALEDGPPEDDDDELPPKRRRKRKKYRRRRRRPPAPPTPRTAAARRDVAAFEVKNRYQREVAGLLRAIIDHIERRLSESVDSRRASAREIDRWWRVFGVYRRALEFPELAGRRAFDAFEKLMDLRMPDLLEVARKGRLGQRMPKRKKRRKGRPRCVKR